MTIQPNPPTAENGGATTPPVKGPELTPGPSTAPNIDLTPKAGDGSTQVNSGSVGHQYNYFPPSGPSSKPLTELPEEWSKLPPRLHPFRAPNHADLLQALERERILVVASYHQDAALAVAHALGHDDSFAGTKKHALYPTRPRDKERSDLDLMSLTDDAFLGPEPQVLLIVIDGKCAFLDSLRASSNGVMGRVCGKLEDHTSYMILSVDECLLEDDERAAERIGDLRPHSISHLRYLLAPHYAGDAAGVEKRLSAALRLDPVHALADCWKQYPQIDRRLENGAAEFEAFLVELESKTDSEAEIPREVLRTVEAPAFFAEPSEANRAAAFVAAYLPELNQQDFDRFVALLLGDATTTRENMRQVFRRDGKLITVREEKQERWTDCWRRDGDKIFGECHLRTAVSQNGSWIVDFCEPSLRDELRGYIETHHPWYLRRQCERLRTSEILFERELSLRAVDGLVQLFLARAVVDPAVFGSLWLLDLVQNARRKFGEAEHPFFDARLATLLREMLDHEGVRRVVYQFFELLLAAGEHDALLDVVFELAQRLRFAPYFDPLIWMRRLLDQGSSAVQARTNDSLIDLAARSGPRIYAFLRAIRSWLPDEARLPANFSPSNRTAIEFPFYYCAHLSNWVESGVWPSAHPLFYALPGDPIEARVEIATLVEWILDTRGAALEKGEASNPLEPADAVRMGHVADLVEHWAWVLEGPREDGPAEGRALFANIIEELNARITPRERTWLQRRWQRRQEEQLREAAANADRTIFIARKKKLEQLRMRFVSLPRILDI